ncbi:MAG: hypothetical protein ACI8VW_001486 [bacterium]|jgi:hypothetical protein
MAQLIRGRPLGYLAAGKKFNKQKFANGKGRVVKQAEYVQHESRSSKTVEPANEPDQ